MQQLQPLYVDLAGENAYPRGVTTRARHALDKVAADHIVTYADDRGTCARTLRSDHNAIACSEDQVHVLRDEVGGERRKRLVRSRASPHDKSEVTPSLPAEFG